MRANLRTLLVDDNSTNLKILERTLKHHFSHLVDITTLKHASDGIEALQVYEKNKFDLILLDIDMPRMSGVQVAQTIREANQGIIIIACTTSDSASSRALYDEVGMDGCVCKPLDLRALNDSLINSLYSRESIGLYEVTGSPEIYERYLVHRGSAPVAPTQKHPHALRIRATTETAVNLVYPTAESIPTISPVDTEDLESLLSEGDGNSDTSEDSSDLRLATSVESIVETRLVPRRTSSSSVPCACSRLCLSPHILQDNFWNMLSKSTDPVVCHNPRHSHDYHVSTTALATNQVS